MATKNKQRTESLKKIIKAARNIFVKFGFSASSMSMIAKEANANQALIYHYFPSKIELWKAVKQSAINDSLMQPDYGSSHTETFDEFLSLVITNRFNFYTNNPDLRVLIAWEKIQASYINLYGTKEKYNGIFTEHIKILQNNKKINTSLDPKLIDALIISSCDAVFDLVPYMYSENEIKEKQQEYLQMLKKILMEMNILCDQ